MTRQSPEAAVQGALAVPLRHDFRSDTITQPTPAMRAAMAEAEVGDDVFAEDPTIARLEEEVACGMGMEAGLFVPSGTMANQIAIWAHTGRHGQVVCDENCHIALYEGGAAGLLSGATVRTIATERGAFGPAQLSRHVYPDDPHFAATKLVAIEQTHNWSGGRTWSVAATDAIIEAAHASGAAVHVDGARIFNAAVALDEPVARLVRGADSVMFCLSKGLCAPVGSVLCGTEEFIAKGRHIRKVLGGGMRQAGVLAAAGLVALDTMVERLSDDHALARRLAKGLADIPKLGIDLEQVETNMVLVDTTETGMTGPDFCELMLEAGIGCLPRDNGPTARFVTHHDVGEGDVDGAVERIANILA